MKTCVLNPELEKSETDVSNKIESWVVLGKFFEVIFIYFIPGIKIYINSQEEAIT